MLISIDAIRENGNARHVKVAPEADAGLTASIRAQGVLQAVLLRPDGDGYILVAGHRRLRCALAAGLDEIPAEVREMTDRQAQAAQAAENMQRVAMHPIDQWRAVRDLIAAGYTVPNAAAALGLDERQTRRMERLGMLDPKLLALIETHDSLPDDGDLRVIANAPRTMQAKATKVINAVTEWRGEKQVNWDYIADACRITRFSRGIALFDPDAIKWDVDFFAQPGANDEYTTTDRKTFMRLQRQALEAQVADAQAQKKRIQLVEFNDSTNYNTRGPALPAGFQKVYSGYIENPKRTECVFVALTPAGTVERVLCEDTKAAKAAQAKKAERAKTGDSADDDDSGGDDDTDAGDDAAQPPVEKYGITKAGLALIAAAKTQALRETLRDGLSELPPERLLTLMILAWGALNVSVTGMDAGSGYRPDRHNFRDVAARFLLPGGGLPDVSMADAKMHAADVMARILRIGEDSGFYKSASGPAAEWIGAAIGADQALPRFDTAAFLAQVSGDELRRAATAAGEKSTGTVKALREKLTGKMPDWRPDAAAFGAPAPLLQGGQDNDDD